ncbi:MAG: conserved rane protein of unknown function [Nitrospira sp.]|jgi:quinol-cytochrome oxidoreductase complex cytochrome b subunit|nr:conserved rane protein of unknown function [Nitrospira sp.]
MSSALNFAVGALLGGLLLSAAWGLLWLVVGAIGLWRRTCSWRVVANSLVIAVVPLLLAWALLSVPDEVTPNMVFVAGLLVMPFILAGLALRPVSGGHRAGASMLRGIGLLIDDLLGRHQACGGCDHDHGPDVTGGTA